MAEERPPQPPHQVPLYVVVGRILVVSGMSISAAASIFFFLGGVWEVGLAALVATVIFLGLMFLIESAASP